MFLFYFILEEKMIIYDKCVRKENFGFCPFQKNNLAFCPTS